ncbi:hypothetical protein RR46_07365 [Papilio xuthus]|uniref:Uncharacterized protein n=1 Tax=Papilio xuthus TaxID=66420 RepID=A0A194PX76_PAPXU|nr:hypothetical protein RR46_07365 [Papilio xuthus]
MRSGMCAGQWAVTVAGSCRAALPTDVEMRLRFPDTAHAPRACPPPAAQPDQPLCRAERCVGRRSTPARVALALTKEASDSSILASKSVKKSVDSLPDVETFRASRTSTKHSVKVTNCRRRGRLPAQPPAMPLSLSLVRNATQRRLNSAHSTVNSYLLILNDCLPKRDLRTRRCSPACWLPDRPHDAAGPLPRYAPLFPTPFPHFNAPLRLFPLLSIPPLTPTSFLQHTYTSVLRCRASHRASEALSVRGAAIVPARKPQRPPRLRDPTHLRDLCDLCDHRTLKHRTT